MPVNFQKLRNALKWAQKNPEHFNMEYWINEGDLWVDIYNPISERLCGTTFCLAGTIVFQAGKEAYDIAVKNETFSEEAVKVLTGCYPDDLRKDEALFAKKLEAIFANMTLNLDQVSEKIESLMAEFAHLDSSPKIALT